MREGQNYIVVAEDVAGDWEAGTPLIIGSADGYEQVWIKSVNFTVSPMYLGGEESFERAQQAALQKQRHVGDGHEHLERTSGTEPHYTCETAKYSTPKTPGSTIRMPSKPAKTTEPTSAAPARWRATIRRTG